MLFNKNAFSLELKDHIYHLVFNLKDQATNVFNRVSLDELAQCLEIMKSQKAQGLLFSSAKEAFILGADITEFLEHFKKSQSDMIKWISEINLVFNGIEDLPFPKVCAINGFALGGGLEIALTMDYRIASQKASVGLPETKLGIIPGWGGTVRLPRLIGADHAIEWVASGKHYKADDALKFGVVDAVVPQDQLLSSALTTLKRAIEGELKWEERSLEKKSPLKFDKIESLMSFEGSKAFVMAQAGPNYPAPLKAIESMEKGAKLHRDEALQFEHEAFAFCSKTSTAASLVQVFLGDQYLKKVSKSVSKNATPITQTAVLGAGIMGGGISYQAATTGTSVLMKDINQAQLELGMNEAGKLLAKQVEYKKITNDKLIKVISSITPTLNYSSLPQVEFVIEAVVENEKIKKSVLKEVEDLAHNKCILASNTSTISISLLAKDLKRPELFCGMHFFNPVHKMPLVEIIRGEKTSEQTIATAVGFALKMGKTPIVVNDCPGFLVNRVLFPYFNGFIFLIDDGVDFQRIDKVMEKFGWPMGPAYLLDVVGIDTGEHASKIMAHAFSDRMGFKHKTILQEMFEQKRFGQKNSKGFYEYELDKKGRPKKIVNPEVYQLIDKVKRASVETTDEDIIMRMMIPMLCEAARCLDEKIVQTHIEVDMGLLLGLGFPPFRAGIFKWADDCGLQKIYEYSLKFKHLGKLYEFTDSMLNQMKKNLKYYQ